MMDTEIVWTCLEYFGVFTALIYLYLELLQKPLMWIVGGISSAVYMAVFAYSRIYADMCFNSYYVAMSFYGFMLWRRSLRDGKQNPTESKVIEYSNISPRQIIWLLISGLLCYAGICSILTHYTDSPIPQWDALTTSLSIIATWMLAKRLIQHWLLWIVITAVSRYLYYLRGLYPTMCLYTLYTAASIWGFFLWYNKGIQIKDYVKE